MTWIDKLRSGVSSLFRKRKRSSPPAAAPASPPPPASTARPPAPLRGRIERGEEFQPGVGSSDYRLFIPLQADPQRPRPLVLMLHGCKQNPDDFAAGTGMDQLGDAEGFFVLYPGQNRKRNPQGCWNWFSRRNQRRDWGEPELIASMVRKAMQDHPVDPSRIYVAGLSAGGAMTALMARNYPDLFAAAAIHAGLPPGAATSIPGAFSAMRRGARGTALPDGHPPVPVLVLQGDQDETVHPDNGLNTIQAMLPSDCSSVEQRISTPGRDVTLTRYLTPGGSIAGELWLVHGLGHAWSGGHPSGSYTDPVGPNASDESLRFFRQYVNPRSRSAR